MAADRKARTTRTTLLKHGTVMDGTGAKGFIGDLLIQDGKIAEISPGGIDGQAEVIDCTGKIIAPGFIDAHSHNDWFLPIPGHDELKAPFAAQGITTFVTGNCGFSAAGYRAHSSFKARVVDNLFQNGLLNLTWDSFAELRQALNGIALSHNFTMLAGHGSIRASIRGFDPTPLKPEELRELLALLEQAMDEGACGVSLGLQYEPGIFSTVDELKAVAQLVKRKDKILTVHMRAFTTISTAYPLKPFGTPHNLLAIKEMLDIARATGVRLEISHLIFVGTRTWKTYAQALALIDEARSQGVDVCFDTYPYHCGCSLINVFLPPWFLARVPQAYDERRAIRRLKLEFLMMMKLLGFGPQDIQITDTQCPDLERYNGMFASEIARARGMSEVDTLIDIARRSNGLARVLNYGYSSPEIIEALIRHPAALFMTDAWIERQGVQNPGCFGAFPRIFELSREHNLVALPELIRKMTGATATRFGIKDRGVLQTGKAADIVVFDPQTIRDTTTITVTDTPPRGIEHVFLNGEHILAGGVVGALSAGRYL